MHKITFSALTLLSCVTQASELTAYTDIAATVAQGDPITFVVNLKDCSASTPLPATTASVTPDSVMITANNSVTASDKHFTLDDPVALGTPVFDYSKFNISSQGNVSIKVTTLNAANYAVLSSNQISCKLGVGFRVYG